MRALSRIQKQEAVQEMSHSVQAHSVASHSAAHIP